MQVVGIVSDARLYNLRESSLYAAYTAHAQDLRGYFSTLLTRGGEVSPPALTRVLDSLGRESLIRVVTLDHVRDRALIAERVAAVIAGFFGALALLITGIGVYGLMSYDVLERANELRIRLALGATPLNVIRSVLSKAIGTAAVGVAAGLVGSSVSVRVLHALLFGVDGYDAVTLGTSAGVLIAVAAIACIWPAMQAARLESLKIE